MGGPTDKATLQKRGSYIKRAPTDKGALQTRGSYRQGALIDKEFIQTKGLYSKGPIGTPTDAVQFLQTRGPYMIYRRCCK